MINDDERYDEYVLVQHSYLPENRLKKWKLRKPMKEAPLKNTILDYWV